MLVEPSGPKSAAGRKGEVVDAVRKVSGRPANRFGQSIEQNVLDTLVCRGKLCQADMEAAIQDARVHGLDLETVLLDRYHLQKHDLGHALSDFYQCPYLPYDERTVLDLELFKTLNIDYLKKHLWLPIARQGTLVDILANDPNDPDRGWDVRRSFPGSSIRYAVGLRRDIEQFLANVTGQIKSSPLGTILHDLVRDIALEQVFEAPPNVIDENDSAVVRLTNHLIGEADRLDASDVHIEPYSDRKDTVVRFRVDGTCFTYMKIPAAYRSAMVSRIKIMANLDIAERRKPQDGKIKFKTGHNQHIELRVATLPTSGGNEDVVLRLLTAKESMSLDAMDFMPPTLGAIKALAEKPHGLILSVGPTGSGKTTTLHALLKHINSDERKIWTVEDPIEITQDGLRQVQVHQKIGLTFAAAMRAFLRADPDVIMVGEMRDKETADIAIEASLTGHLVLSTLHTNSAVETVVRLLDLGCDPFNFADAMLGVLAQRLCKRICSQCKESYHPSRDEYEELVEGFGAHQWMALGVRYDHSMRLCRGRGCESCANTGFRGRLAIHEFLRASNPIKKLIQARAQTDHILAKAMEDGMLTLLQDGILKVLQGLTTFRQVKAVAMK
jgi:type II secretory ATPase GspE/PulE/Tfp pilus assembly ATPase PilB-like protein